MERSEKKFACSLTRLGPVLNSGITSSHSSKANMSTLNSSEHRMFSWNSAPIGTRRMEKPQSWKRSSNDAKRKCWMTLLRRWRWPLNLCKRRIGSRDLKPRKLKLQEQMIYKPSQDQVRSSPTTHLSHKCCQTFKTHFLSISLSKNNYCFRHALIISLKFYHIHPYKLIAYFAMYLKRLCSVSNLQLLRHRLKNRC